jgi:FAD dependent oxidoreductase
MSVATQGAQVFDIKLDTGTGRPFVTDDDGVNIAQYGPYDVLVYGATPMGVVAAVSAARAGASVVIVEPTNHLGGMCSGGLSHTDIFFVLQSSQVTGISDEIFNDLANDYQITKNKFFVNSYNAEPSAFTLVFRRWLQKYNIPVLFNSSISSLVKSGSKIKAATFTLIGEIRAKNFIDTSYEGDLMAKAGVSYTVGRESSAKYSESLGGVQSILAITNQFADGVSPYVVAGNPASGLLPNVSTGTLATAGSADGLIQAPAFRISLTNAATNKIKVDSAPEDYDPLNYELLARHLAISPVTSMASVFSYTPMQGNQKYDFNNKLPGGLDYVNPEDILTYVNGDWDTRKNITNKIKNYTLGLLYWLGYSGDSRIPSALSTDAKTFGLCADEFGENENFPPQLYIREGRRMVSDIVLNQNHVVSAANGLSNQIAVGYYDLDTHQHQYLVVGNNTKGEGTVTPPGMPPANGYIIPYGIIIPKATECTNLHVVGTPSVSHVAWGSVRVEPTLMALGEAAGLAASICASRGLTVQNVPMTEFLTKLNLKKTLERARVLITADGVTGTDGTITQSGAWSAGTSAFGYIGNSYLSDGNARTKTLTITPTIKYSGQYKVMLNYPAGVQYDPNRANNAKVTINSVTGATVLSVDMTSSFGQGGSWDTLGTYTFNAGSTHTIVIDNTPCTNFVLFGALKLVPVF